VANSDRIGVIVIVDDPSEVATKNATYNLNLNGVVQPGGSGDTGATPSLVSKQLDLR
jgi:hypothetical protein